MEPINGLGPAGRRRWHKRVAWLMQRFPWSGLLVQRGYRLRQPRVTIGAVGVLLPNSTTFAWLFNYLYFPLQSTMAALLAFFVVSAVYRAFRLKNAQAFILLATSLIMFFVQLPFSAALIPGLPLVRAWLMAVPITAGVRGILLGAALGTIATSLRVLIGVDRPYAQAPAARAATPSSRVVA